MKLTKDSVKFMLDHPECGPYIVEHYKDGAYAYKQANRLYQEMEDKVNVGRERLILVDPITAQAKKVWRINIWRKNNGKVSGDI